MITNYVKWWKEKQRHHEKVSGCTYLEWLCHRVGLVIVKEL